MEYQGDWDGLTLSSGEDPPVWIKGWWEADEDDGEAEADRTTQVADSLSGFLVTHCLMTTLYEQENSPCSSGDPILQQWFRASPEAAVRIWSAEGTSCPHYAGEFFLLHNHILAHVSEAGVRLGALRPEGVALLQQKLPTIPPRS